MVQQEEAGQGDDEIFLSAEVPGQRFRLERHLHEFLVANWERTELGREWMIYGEPGDEMKGYEYPTGVGRIDILAQNKERSRWLVVELKRDRAADQALGQVLRYMGWVQRHLAAAGDEVRGLIIAPDVDGKLMYALHGIGEQKIGLMQYRVEFHLEPAQGLEQSRT